MNTISQDMGPETGKKMIINTSDIVLVTGSSGFIGRRVVKILLDKGFLNIRCFVRPSSDKSHLINVINSFNNNNVKVDIMEGNLQSMEDCRNATQSASVIYHLAAGRGEKSYPDAYMNSVVTTRNILAAASEHGKLKRFVNISSFTVYSTDKIRRGGLLDETCEMECHPELRGEPYCYSKVRQDEMVIDFGKKHKIPYVIVRPGVVYGPGNKGITGRVGIGTFGLFLHLGGSNIIPLAYVDNCADAIILAGLIEGIDGETFNVVDDNLPTGRKLLKLYKNNVTKFPSVYIPHALNYFLCYLWEKYSKWSKGQLPPVFNRKKYCSYWKGVRYSNLKIKNGLGWIPKVPFNEALEKYFDFQRKVGMEK